MQSKYLLMVGILSALLSAGPAHAQDQKADDTKPPAERSKPAEPDARPKDNEPAKTQEPEADKDDKAAAASAEEEKADAAKAPKRFIPSQRTPADNSASFPVDI